MIDVARIAVPFLIAFLQVFTVALAIGLMPALWAFWKRRRHRMLWRWAIFALVCIGLAAYGLPKAKDAWWWWVTVEGKAPHFFKTVAMWLGYFVGVLFAPMMIPEPLRLARKRMHQDRRGENARRGYRVP